MLAVDAAAPFSSEDWIFEIKWDGIRAISYIYEELFIKSRNQKELKNNFPELKELKDLTNNVVLDGEIIVMKGGKVDFQAILKRVQLSSPQEIEYMTHEFPVTYIIFDILEKENESLIQIPLIERKKILKETVGEGKYVVLSVYIEERGEIYYKAILKNGLEGLMAKEKQSVYEPGVRSNNWLKIKESKSCDCVICGYTIGKGNRRDTFGALLLGLFDNGELLYIGKVGTGFTQDELETLKELFKSLETKDIPAPNFDSSEEIVWLKPQLVCQVKYQSVTETKKLRVPRYRGLRMDKLAEECTLEQID